MILDRSALHGSRFKKLRTSGFVELAESGYFRVYHAETIVEETLKLLTVGKYEQLKRDTLFLLSIGECALRRVTDAMIMELRTQRGISCLFLSASEDYELCHVWRGVAIDPMNAEALQGALDASKRHEESKENFTAKREEMYRDMLRSVDNRPDVTIDVLRAREVYEEYWKADRFETSAALIRERVLLKSGLREDEADHLTRRWLAAPASFPICTTYARAFMYMAFVSKVGPRRYVHRNDQEDIKLITSTIAADVLVSADANFLSSCFRALYVDRHQRLMTPDEFALAIPQSPSSTSGGSPRPERQCSEGA